MTRVDFYILPDVDETARRRFACRLAHRAATTGTRVHILVDEEAAAELDELLWDYPPDRFLPHARLADATGHEPVTLGTETEEPPHEDVLINLGDDVADCFPRFERVAEIVLGNARSAARGKYRRYREGGYPLFHHELEDWE